jgi:hypothetical protein
MWLRRGVALQELVADRLLAMKHPAASGWLPSKWPDAMPQRPVSVHTSQAVTVRVIVMLIALTFLFIGMMPSPRVRRDLPSHIQPSNIPSSITPEGRRYLHELSQKANKISKDQAFLSNAKPCVSRINSHRHLCVVKSCGLPARHWQAGLASAR